MRKMITAPAGATTSNWKKNKRIEGYIELNLYAPADSDEDTMRSMIQDFPMAEVKQWIEKHAYKNLIVIDPT